MTALAADPVQGNAECALRSPSHEYVPRSSSQFRKGW